MNIAYTSMFGAEAVSRKAVVSADGQRLQESTHRGLHKAPGAYVSRRVETDLINF